MFISAGHSETDPGATATERRGGALVVRREADIAVEFRNMVSFYLTQAGVKHEMDGKGTTNLPLKAAANSARNHKIALEFHCNASSNATATGVEVLCAPKDNALAARICDAISRTLGIPNRGVKGENSGQHSRLAFVQAGGMIVELFFISNAADRAAYDARKWLAAREVARCLIP